ncbi:MAG TPA: PAS domain-containing protein [Candidatus Limnocylindria bacterium]|nr:PAS domain-containing protein [Candidatus Limnocylindria bacterium]
MILQVLRARVIAGQEARLMRFVREEAVGPALRVPGLLSFQPAIRETRAGVELVIVSSWNDFQDLAGLGGDLDAPLSMPGAAEMLADSHAEHYELVLGEARAMPLREAKLRLTRIPIRPNVESSYYEAVRVWADRLLDEAGLVAFSLGRRVIGRQDDIVAVQVWQDEAAIRAAGGTDIEKPMGGDELSQFWAAEPSIEHFDALTAVEPRTDAPAILLADDSRRYVHATPAAALLVGRPLARLLTMRVEDVAPPDQRAQVASLWDRFVADGSARGPYTVERPDGSQITVKFAAKANAPWPGSHASLLVAHGPANGHAATDDDGDDLDIDRALVEAGLVARYAHS